MTPKEKLRQSVRLHQEAMDHANDAFMAQLAGNDVEYKSCTRKAHQKESRSAELLRHDPSHHMHAILHRSAATLAIRCGEYRAAESLIAHGLAGDPDQGLREQLTELRDEVRQQLAQANGKETGFAAESAPVREQLAIESLPAGK